VVECPVMIVEDDETDAQLVKESFLRHGWPMLVAETGEQALSMLRTSETVPRCVLLDLKLRGHLDGFDTLRLLRANPRTARVPVIVYTASYTQDDLVQAFELGAASVIRRPVESPAKVLAMVEWFIGDLDARLRSARVRVKRQFLELQGRADESLVPGPPSGIEDIRHVTIPR